MSTQTFIYKGKTIKIDDQDDQLKLSINDHPIQVSHNRESGKFRAPLESFLVYSSLEELAKSLIDNLDFDNR